MTAHKSDISSSIPDEPMTLTLRLRSGPSAVAKRRQRRITERLETIVDDDELSTLRTGRWSDRVRVPAAEGSAAVEAVTLYEELHAAVDEAGGRLHPFFQERETLDRSIDAVDAGPADGERDIVFPVICLTIRRSGRLTGVYPCWLDGEHHSVEDGLARLDGSTNVADHPPASESEDPENLW